MIIIYFLFAVSSYAAELPTIIIEGKVTAYDDKKICITNTKQICIVRSERTNHLVNTFKSISLVVHKDELLIGDSK